MSEAHELLKVPHLISHYIQHKEDRSETSLANYLHEHYCHDHEDHDQDEHHDNGCLPFQGNHSCGSCMSSVFFQGNTTFNLKPAGENADSFIPTEENAISSYHANIWQPPKIG